MRMTAGSNQKSQNSRLDRFLMLLPLYLTYGIVIGTWLAFLTLITINEILLRRHDVGRFLEQAVILNGLFGLTIISLITASNRSPGSPDPNLAPDKAREKRHNRAEGWDEDIPLRSLRDSRNRSEDDHRQTRPSDIMVDGVEYDGNAMPGDTPSTSSSYYPEISPFPLNLSPFVPTTATDVGEDQDGAEQYEDDMHPNEVSSRGHGSREEDEAVGDVHERLLSESLSGSGITRGTIFAKSSSGGIRWCKKCDAWKPDRCHHCRHCRKCTLKMDHHCVWLGTCVGLNNYKPFLLFITYGTLLSLYIFIEGCVCTVQYFSHPSDYTSSVGDDLDENELPPVSFMFLAVVGGFFTLTIGGLAGYHWYLACSNKTTLEDVTHAFPSALIGSEDTQPVQWRGDHLLSRAERVRLRDEASALNVYDLGWRRNLESIFSPGSPISLGLVLRCLWPVAVTGNGYRHDATAGHFFEYDPAKLERLRNLTIELRLGKNLTPVTTALITDTNEHVDVGVLGK